MAAAPVSLRRSGVARFWDVLRALTMAEVRSQRDLSVTGVAKWMLEPVAMMFVFFLLLSTVLEQRKPAFLLFLFASLLPFRFFSGVLTRAMTLINGHGATITNRVFPREVLPLTLLGSEGASFVISLPLFFVLMALYGIPPTAALLWLPAIVAVLFLLTLGPAYILTVFGLYFPDYRGVVQNLTRAAYFLSGGLFSVRVDVPGDRLPLLFQLNPLTGVFESFRSVFIAGEAPPRIGMLYPLAVGVVLLAVGVPLYRWRQHQFAKEV